MCKHGTTLPIKVKIPADLSCSGKEKVKYAQIDSCIAPLVDALQKGGVDMRGSCCGHGKGEGDIHLQDGRVLLILDRYTASMYMLHKEKINVTKYINNMAKKARWTKRAWLLRLIAH